MSKSCECDVISKRKKCDKRAQLDGCVIIIDILNRRNEKK